MHGFINRRLKTVSCQIQVLLCFCGQSCDLYSSGKFSTITYQQQLRVMSMSSLQQLKCTYSQSRLVFCALFGGPVGPTGPHILEVFFFKSFIFFIMSSTRNACSSKVFKTRTLKTLIKANQFEANLCRFRSESGTIYQHHYTRVCLCCQLKKIKSTSHFERNAKEKRFTVFLRVYLHTSKILFYFCF